MNKVMHAGRSLYTVHHHASLCVLHCIDLLMDVDLCVLVSE